MSFETVNVVKLHVENNEACLEIAPDPDAPEFGVLLHTPDEKSQKWFGGIRLTLSIQECKKLGEALVVYAEQLEQHNA